MNMLFAEHILLSHGTHSQWHNNKTLLIDNGVIVDIVDGQLDGADIAEGPVIPGMVNCHSHAFQRGFAGFSEQGSQGNDSFWTWRKIMYQFLDVISVEQAQVIANQLYIEMVKAGYTRVAEFHYLHHQPDGQNYHQLAAMADALFDAAEQAGIGITMLPVLYRYSGFGPLPANDGQKRFINDVEQFNQLVSDCFASASKRANANVGIAPHSLRAVDKPSLQAAVTHVRNLDATAPIHIHIAEQQKEVNDCHAHYGMRPVQWLLDNMSIDQHWCLIHATHIDQQELQGIVDAGAVAGICPTTEANLGDGIFPTTEFISKGGRVAIGSDSHISVSAIEELRLLEYAQRLVRQQRAILADNQTPSVGQFLWHHTAQAGALSTSSNSGELAVGKQADLIVLSNERNSLFANSTKHLLDSVVFASQASPIKDVMVNGQWVVRDGKHAQEQQVADRFATVLQDLAGNR
ncbi:formimidoylglutamate deiminase [Thalassotalea ponticola]|uniref:formimidoylglutamate deiminase n=1 Tax=Thalassotalea ponticola TaxID=1523392 RepID=UPI0025B3CCA7|nr:formimidoylglutamate deiminase [Thalassotalea ponticola]MDN3652447.1 formimidoylglutamate deiminase [Thalassotalea ponticola]